MRSWSRTCPSRATWIPIFRSIVWPELPIAFQLLAGLQEALDRTASEIRGAVDADPVRFEVIEEKMVVASDVPSRSDAELRVLLGANMVTLAHRVFASCGSSEPAKQAPADKHRTDWIAGSSPPRAYRWSSEAHRIQRRRLRKDQIPDALTVHAQYRPIENMPPHSTRHASSNLRRGLRG